MGVRRVDVRRDRKFTSDVDLLFQNNVGVFHVYMIFRETRLEVEGGREGFSLITMARRGMVEQARIFRGGVYSVDGMYIVVMVID